jgi:hypothetical protein
MPKDYKAISGILVYAVILIALIAGAWYLFRSKPETLPLESQTASTVTPTPMDIETPMPMYTPDNSKGGS